MQSPPKKPSPSKENKDTQEPLKVCVNQPAEVRTLLNLRKPTASFKRLQPPNSDATSYHLEDLCHQKVGRETFTIVYLFTVY